MSNKTTRDFLPVAQEYSESDEASETGAMLDHEYAEPKPRSRYRRILGSPIPWICTTTALGIYVLVTSLLPQQPPVAWSSTDASKYLMRQIVA